MERDDSMAGVAIESDVTESIPHNVYYMNRMQSFVHHQMREDMDSDDDDKKEEPS
jgi:hypothetical protein